VLYCLAVLPGCTRLLYDLPLPDLGGTLLKLLQHSCAMRNAQCAVHNHGRGCHAYAMREAKYAYSEHACLYHIEFVVALSPAV
jgi:hypothetical protein